MIGFIIALVANVAAAAAVVMFIAKVCSLITQLHMIARSLPGHDLIPICQNIYGVQYTVAPDLQHRSH